jgi:hypothetical protein
VTPLRTRAIDAILKEWDDGLPLSASLAVDALLAANLLHDPTATIDAAPCGATDSGAPVVGAPRTATSSGPCFGATWKPAPRDDEARIERAARADEAVDVVTRVCREADSWFVADGGSTRHWARDHFLPALRAEGYVIALAAADQEEKP